MTGNGFMDEHIGHPAAEEAQPSDDLQPVITAQSFWAPGPQFAACPVHIEPPPEPLPVLERLGPIPFDRGGFPLTGFLATAYERVSRFALQRAEGYRPPPRSAE